MTPTLWDSISDLVRFSTHSDLAGWLTHILSRDTIGTLTFFVKFFYSHLKVRVDPHQILAPTSESRREARYRREVLQIRAVSAHISPSMNYAKNQPSRFPGPVPYQSKAMNRFQTQIRSKHAGEVRYQYTRLFSARDVEWYLPGTLQ